MTKEEKQLLIKELCARFPYGVICRLSVKSADISITEKLKIGGLEHFISDTMNVLPYLRPMSSMTLDERKYYNQLSLLVADGEANAYEEIDWLLSHHFDFRGLIPKGLALEAPEGMYKTN